MYNQELQRCGECGRSYTKPQWRRNENWCPKCQKFICYDCLIRNYKCPVCGSLANKRSSGMMIVAGGMSLLVVPMLILFIYQVGIYHPTTIVALIASMIFIIILPYSYFSYQAQKKKHHEYLSGLPPGIVPLKDRSGYDSRFFKEERKKIKKLHWKYSDELFESLIGNWSTPIISKQRRIEIDEELFHNNLPIVGGMIIFGIILMITGWFINSILIVLLIGLLFILIGILGYYVIAPDKGIRHGDKVIETRVGLKDVKLNLLDSDLRKFLKQNNEQFVFLNITGKKSKYYDPPIQYKYKFNNDNYIEISYQRFEGSYYGWLNIGYRFAYYLHAKELQKRLDTFLREHDYIEIFP